MTGLLDHGTRPTEAEVEAMTMRHEWLQVLSRRTRELEQARARIAELEAEVRRLRQQQS